MDRVHSLPNPEGIGVSRSHSHNCDLGYELKIEKKGQVKGMDLNHISPKSGTCPKPLTLKELMAAPHAHWGK